MPAKKTTTRRTTARSAAPSGWPRPGAPTCVATVCVFAYFVIFPTDLETLTIPITIPIRVVLEIFKDVSPWLYATGIAGILGWTVNRVWGRAR
ncbi:MAG: hypothetical protein O7J95_16275 [Planctomycetota bacterium]|nr:hypothetical protein [Planctomycetota bacterium]